MRSSSLYLGSVMHRRLRPKVHQLRYRIFSLLLDLDEIDALDRELRLFSRRRFNLLSFHDSDHGDGSATPLREQVERLLARAGLADVGRIRLLAMPRMLGFVFNPLSMFFCDNCDGRLAAIVYEVHNTFGERHSYVLPVESESGAILQDSAKRFHVSPFLPMELDYSFRVTPPGERLSVAIAVADASGPLLIAVHSAERRVLSDAAILRAVASHPLMTVKVVAGILWEAARLLGKGVKVHRHPPAPEQLATIRMANPPAPIARAA